MLKNVCGCFQRCVQGPRGDQRHCGGERDSDWRRLAVPQPEPGGMRVWAAQADSEGIKAWFYPEDWNSKDSRHTRVYMAPSGQVLLGNYDQVNRFCSQTRRSLSRGLRQRKPPSVFTPRGSKDRRLRDRRAIGRWRTAGTMSSDPWAGGGSLLGKIQRRPRKLLCWGGGSSEAGEVFGAQATGLISGLTEREKTVGRPDSPAEGRRHGRSLAMETLTMGICDSRIRDSGGWAEDVPMPRRWPNSFAG